MIDNQTPQRLRVLEMGRPLIGFPELLESGALTNAESHVYRALALQRLEAGRLELEFAALLAAGVGSKKKATE